MDGQKGGTSDRKYKLIPIVLSIMVLIVSGITLYLNYPAPNLEIGMFPIKGTVFSNSIIVTWSNSSGQMVANVTYDNSTAYTEYNFTYQVYNSGKGVARNVNVSLSGEPSDTFKVLSTNVYVDEPLNSNLLDTVKNEYQIGLLGAGKSYTFLFSVSVPAGKAEQGKFVLRVESDNAGTQSQDILFKQS